MSRVEFAHPRQIIGEDEALQPDAHGDDPHDVAQGHRLAAVVGVDHPANGEARVAPGERQRGVEMVAADIVEIDVDAVSGGGGGERLDQRPVGVVDRRVGAERADEVAFLGRRAPSR